MSFSSINPWKQYAGNSVTVNFSFPYLWKDDDHVIVVLTDSDGVDTIQTITTHYTLVGLDNPSGGTVTMVTSPATNELLSIFRLPDFFQNTAIGGYFAASTELQLDLTVMMCQYLKLKTDRSVGSAMTEIETLDMDLPKIADRANTVLGFDATGAPMVVAANSSKRSVIVSLYDGGDVLATGKRNVNIEVPYSGTITAVRLLADQTGSVIVDIWKDSYTNYPPTVADTITASAKPTISSALKSEDTSLAGWTTSITEGDILEFNIDSITNITALTVSLSITQTGS